MTRTRKVNPAASVVRQARAKANIVNFEEAKFQLTKLERGTDDDGHPTIAGIFPGTGSSPDDKHDLSFLLQFPHLAGSLAHAFMRWGLMKAVLARKTVKTQLRNGLLKYLQEHSRIHVTLNDLNRPFWIACIVWLNRPISGTGQPLSPKTRGIYL